MRVLASVMLILGLVACGPAPTSRSGGDILVIGDSVMAWNKGLGADIGSVIGERLTRSVVNRAVGGARIRAGGGASLIGLSIPEQLTAGAWDWVVMNGAANDLGFNCGCTRCADEIEALISADGTRGDIPDLIARAEAQGAHVLWMGYYAAPNSTAFPGCRPGLVEIERRISRLAAARPGLIFVDAEDIFDPPDPTLFASDRTHPSVKGSAIIGTYLADVIARHS
ncbi:SGNH/GDSL hydrolase family protein [Shimia biformata]|uniref:SGNH/GDSL hydrolase family protein n=1 Tax=Shimia biformata TaxID=1294299 RepID=UPI00194FC096|nr:SGNH/GDSL hydrolase family protein [Shimia biformata]